MHENNLLLITFSLHGNFPFDRLYNLRITTHAKSMPTINKPKTFHITQFCVAKIVQTRAETNLFGYAECRLFSHFCKDSANEGQKNHLVMPNVAHLRAYANVHKSFNRNYKNPENRVLA